MREFSVEKNDAGQRLDRWLAKSLPLLPAGLAQKYIRIKRIKVNGRGGRRDLRLAQGDVIQLYINDEFFGRQEADSAFFRQFRPQLDILYEDAQLLLVNKRPGLVVHGDEREKVNTLIHHIQAHLYQSGAWNPAEEQSFVPALCNRIDRNTGGIVIAAKTAEAMRILNQKIRDRELIKQYLCAAAGRLSPPAGRLSGYLWKDAEKNQVYVRSRPEPGAKTAVTLYRTLAVRQGLSLLECQLITGRTHQIRAQLAAAGHPLAGDGKYGSRQLNQQWGRRQQALYSYRLEFRFSSDAGILSYLDGQSWTVRSIDFVSQLFPDYVIP